MKSSLFTWVLEGHMLCLLRCLIFVFACLPLVIRLWHLINNSAVKIMFIWN